MPAARSAPFARATAMEPTHRFSESEIQEVFARAAEAQKRDDRERADLGLTMDELQSAGAEAGLDPAHVAAAARAVASGEPDDRRETLVGLPVGVRRAATIDAPPSDELWEMLVADLQDTFSARGKTERIGEARIWRNGNLRATLGPSGDGARLRIQSNRREDTQRLLIGSVVSAVMAVVFSLNVFGPEEDPVAFLAVVALGLAALAVVRQVSWTNTREQQMEAVIGRTQRSAKALGLGASASDADVVEPGAAPLPPPRLDLLDLGDDARQPAAAPGRRLRS